MRPDEPVLPPSAADFSAFPPGMRWFLVRQGVPADSHLWGGYVHGLAAYRLYMQDRLPEAVAATEAALARGTYGRSEWLANVLYKASAELEAREHGQRVEQPPFLWELPGEGRRFRSLVRTAEEVAERVERLFGFERPKTLFTLLPRGSLIRYTDASHGYMVPKEPYFKICLPEPGGAAEAAEGLIHEYVHVAIYELSHWKAPRWVHEGVAQWVEEDLVHGDHGGEPLLPPGDRPRLGRIEGLFHAEGDLEGMDPLDYAYDASLAAVRDLIARHGEYDVREFVARLATEDEGRAFRQAFGESQGQFERRWHEHLRKEEQGS